MAPSLALLALALAPFCEGKAKNSMPLVYFGVDYYPEQWPRERIKEDMTSIKNDLGADVIRIGEFSWHIIEPEDGKFEFEFWDHVLELAKEIGLHVMFGTVTATIPAWLAKKHPEILSVGKDGQKRVFGGRRQYSFNSRIFRQYASRITRVLLQRYGRETNIFSWQIDNELGHEGSDDDYSQSSVHAWTSWLAEKYKGNITDLNYRWGNVFWSQSYNSFDEVPAPLPTITRHNPALLVDWRWFRSDSINSFLVEQRDIVRRFIHEDATITTNFPGGFFSKVMNFALLGRQMDFVAYDNYPVWGGLEKPLPPAQIALALDICRGILPALRTGVGSWVPGRGGRGRRHFVIAEQLIGAQGHDEIGYLPRPGEAKSWAIQSLLHGANGLIFFRWRSAQRAQEVFCYGVQDVNSEHGRRFQEARETFSFGRLYSSLLAAPIRAKVALLYSYQSVFAWQSQRQSKNLDPEIEATRLYHPFWRWGMPIDALDAGNEETLSLISRSSPEISWVYDIVILPAPISLPDGLYDALVSHVQGGGSLYIGFRSDLKDSDMAMLPNSRLATLAGVKIQEIESLGSTEVSVTDELEFGDNRQTKKPKSKRGTKTSEANEYKVEVWREMLQPLNPGIETIYRYSDSFFSEYTAVSRRRWKRGGGEDGGEVVYVGCGIDPEALIKLAGETLKFQGILGDDGFGPLQLSEPSPSGNVEILHRTDAADRSWTIITNFDQIPHKVGQKTIKPFETVVLLPEGAPRTLSATPLKNRASTTRPKC